MFGKFRLIPLIAVLMLAALPVSAGGLGDSIVRQLRQQGYDDIEVSRTWLGRTRILALRGDQRREIIINPRTGEILRDFWTAGDDSATLILSAPTVPAADEGGSEDPAEPGDTDDSGGNGNGPGGGRGGVGNE